MSETKNPAEDRLTDPGVFIIGDEVIYDGEAEKHGIEPKRRIPRKRKSISWPDSDE